MIELIVYDTKFEYIVEGKVKSCKLKVIKNGEILRRVTLEHGKVYKVLPDNKNKQKHRNKVGVLLGFKTDKNGRTDKARIKFDETNRVGYVDIEDLHHFKNE